ncbi:chemotaxis protein CheB [Aliifodinibius sp. S!AR15-10]|uniref:chemotaxis protein CheB n=1 Tax=Aliifodinibius sp. S!AR15-10 TaxID=2950437 RepID=UPI0028593A2D|nr:chemotaxis protein CheB [Aliifodinibius sp. S!AR15-10]MDR8393271.1 chemotaxis protein CheB [Aliifodinibius sp. S!AR15-10]
MTKILVIDGDVITRRAIAQILQEKTQHQIVINGESNRAVEHIIEAEPDLLLLGISPDSVEEIAQLSTIKIRFPNLSVIILSERSEPGAAVVIAALRLGAVDFITKSENFCSMLFAERHLTKRLIPIVEASLRANHGMREGTMSQSFEKDLTSIWPLNLITIGGCTGGPAALFKLIETLPKNFNIPIVAVQHLPKYYTKVLAARLDEVSDLEVREATDGVVLNGGGVWIAPGGFHSEVHRDGNETVLKVHKGPREHDARPSIDMLFRSAGRLYGPGAMGVILSGCGKDGVAGAGAIKQAGGHVLVQDISTSLMPDLPLAVVKTGYCDIISPTEQMVQHFLKRDKGAVRPYAEAEIKKREISPTGYSEFRYLDKHLFSTLN